MMMDERKFRILQAIIDDYILTAVPVGSRTISKKYDMGLSSATIRNEMSDLEELGYLDQPHVSAGRIPSAKAYRLYVDQLLKTGRIPSDSDAGGQGAFSGAEHQMEDVIDHAAQVLSSLTSYTAVVLPPTGKMPKIRTIQLVPVIGYIRAGRHRDGYGHCPRSGGAGGKRSRQRRALRHQQDADRTPSGADAP